MTLLKEMMSRILLVLFLFSFGSGQQDVGIKHFFSEANALANDLCSQSSIPLTTIMRRWLHVRIQESVDDSKHGGYYIKSYDASLLDYPPGVGRCGGKYPIWQKELKTDSAVVCVQNENDTCFKEFEVSHQKCRRYTMYELRTVVKGSVFCLQPKFCHVFHYDCANGGTCIDERDGISCQCPEGFSGPTCEGDPCSISRPLPDLHKHLPSNNVAADDYNFLERWYSVPKGVKMTTHLSASPSCGSSLPGWSVGSWGNMELICELGSYSSCVSNYVLLKKTCANTRVYSLYYGSICLECHPGPLDVLVIEDVSSSVMNSDYKKMKDFILDNIRALNISRTGNNVAFLSFASTAKVGFHLNTYSNTTDVAQAIESAHGTGGGTLVSTALELSVSDVFTYHNGDRADVDNIVLLFTDGRFKDEFSLKQDIETLKARAEIYVVTVGPVVSNTTVVEMATTLDHILKLSDPSTATVITSALNPTCDVEQ